MDIDLLAKMVKEAILDHDAVTLPGVGAFVAEWMPSTFSDKGYTINPPYRRLYFSPRQGADTLLADLYARDNEGIDSGMAARILSGFLAEMKEVLKVRKTIVLPGLGRLRATRENHFFFVADEDLDIYPEGFGLPPLSLKTHVETPEEVATAVAELAGLMTEPAPEIPGQAGNDEVKPEPVEEIPDQVGNDEVEPESIEEIPVQAGNDEVQDVNDEVGPEPVEEIPVQAGNDEVQDVNDEVGPEPVEEIPDQVGNDEVQAVADEPAPKPRRRWLRVLLIVLGVVLLLLVAFILIGRFAPAVLDPILYSREELEILRY